ncbi:GIY-YIG nuclease family protein [bacterium]|nr:GIY-YIG nuclease family protein [FCB group bacterium]MBL7190919.1 GIY-YIG nuclease family protein [bacterium]
MTNASNDVLYTGMTNNIIRRVYEHKNRLFKGFSAKYNTKKLVYYEIYQDAITAINREKQIKAGSRLAKIRLIESSNKNWKDLYDELL